MILFMIIMYFALLFLWYFITGSLRLLGFIITTLLFIGLFNMML